ncbi:MAG: translocation/assembly module TamB domain-containing protein [Myxococcota bacterium]|nr:translocation/assembly module TamB domain-containing protein [Myxococcota bacterium]MDW8362576.1 translocation/assembly module TamB domain-containing protein [Myxococcales bacterium]
MAGLVAAVWLSLRSETARAALRDLVVELLRAETGLEATLSPVEVELLPRPALTARELRLSHPVHGVLVTAQALTIHPSIGALFRGRIDMKSVEVTGAVVTLRMRDGRLVNGPRLSGAGGGQVPFERLLASVSRVELDAAPLVQAWWTSVDVGAERTRQRDRTTVTLTLAARSGQLLREGRRETLGRMETTVRWDGANLAVQRLEAQGAGWQLAVQHAEAPLPWTGRWSVRGRVAADLTRVEQWLAQLVPGMRWPTLRGRLEVEAELRTGAGRMPSGQGLVRWQSARIGQWGLGDGQLEVVLDEGEIRVLDGSALDVVGGGGRLALRGRIGVEEGWPVSVSFDVRELQFARLMEQLGVTPNAIVRWTFDGSGQLTGTLWPPRFGGPLRVRTRDLLVSRDAWHADPVRPVVGVPRATLSARLRVDPAGLSFENIVAETAGSRLHADVRFPFAGGLILSVQADPLDVADASPLLDFAMRGRGRAALSVHGPFERLDLRGQIKLSEFVFHDTRLGDVESDFTLESDGLVAVFPNVSARKGEHTYQIAGLRLDFRDGRFRATGRVHSERIALADLYHAFGYEQDERFTPYQAVASGVADVTFTLGHPGDSPTGTLLVDVDASLLGAELQGYAFDGGHFSGRWRWKHRERGYRGGELEVERLSLSKGAGTIAVRGRMGLEGALAFSVVGDALALSTIEGVANRLPALDGWLGFAGTLRGTAEVPAAELDAHLTALRWNDRVLGDARAYVRLTDTDDPWVTAARWGVLDGPSDEPCAAARAGLREAGWPADPPLRTVEGPRPRLPRPMAWLVCGEGLGGNLTFDLAVGRTQVHPLRGVVRLAQWSLDPWLADATGGALSGRVSGTVHVLGGALLDEDSLVATVRLDTLEVGDGSLALRAREPVVLDVDRGRLRLTRVALVGPSSSLALSGSVSLRHGLDVSLVGRVDLGLLATLSPRFEEVRGQVGVEATVRGTIAQPLAYGRARLEEGRFLFAGMPEPVEGLTGEVVLSGRRLQLEAVSARFAGGELRLHGGAVLGAAGFEQYDIEIALEGARWMPDEEVEVAAGAQGRLVWREGERLPRLEGQVRIDRLVYGRDVALARSLEDLGRREVADVEEHDPSLDRLVLDVRIVEGGPLRVANNLLDASVRIDETEGPLRIVGSDRRPSLLGALALERGRIRFRNTDFELDRGTVRFDDPTRVRPVFDVRATTEIRRADSGIGPSWRVALHAHGAADSFRIDTWSDPPLAEEDIALLLALGMTRAELEQLQAADLTSTAVLEALTTVTGAEGLIRQALPVVDEVHVRTRYSPRTGRTEPELAVGRRVADGVRLSASTVLGEAREVRTGLEWMLGERTSVEAAYDNVESTATAPVGNLGLDLRWRLEFD